METAAFLVQVLAKDDPREVVGAMNALARRGHAGLVPGLILLHWDESVLREAMRILGTSRRLDWVPLARRLLKDPREALRMAAARALAQKGQLDADLLATDADPRVRGYCAVHLALRANAPNLRADRHLAAVLRLEGEAGAASRLGILAAIADAARGARLGSLLLSVCDPACASPETRQLFARAALRQADVRLVPALLELLTARAGREDARAALVAIGEPAYEVVSRALTNPEEPRALRVHLPKTLARFGTKRASEFLLQMVEMDHGGLLGDKCIRALEVIASQQRFRVDRVRVERLCRANLEEHFRLLSLRGALEPTGSADLPSQVRSSERLLVGLLEDKLQQSLDRAFRLLKIAHPAEDVHRVQIAFRSTDGRLRANAGEFLDTWLRRRDQQPMRELLRLVANDLPAAERAARFGALSSRPLPHTREEALAILAGERDPLMAALAELYATALGIGSRGGSQQGGRLPNGEDRAPLFQRLFHVAERVDGHA